MLGIQPCLLLLALVAQTGPPPAGPATPLPPPAASTPASPPEPAHSLDTLTPPPPPPEESARTSEPPPPPPGFEPEPERGAEPSAHAADPPPGDALTPAPKLAPIAPPVPPPAPGNPDSGGVHLGHSRKIPLVENDGLTLSLVGLNVVLGGTAGAILGGSRGAGIGLGGLGLGAVALGGAGYLYTELVPESAYGLSMMAMLSGGLASLGGALITRVDGWTGTVMVIGGSQLGLLVTLLMTFSADRISAEDSALVRMVGSNFLLGYAFALWALASVGAVGALPLGLLFMPAAGMLMGGLLASVLEVPVERSDMMALAPPCVAAAVGGLVFWIDSDHFRRTVGPAAGLSAAGAFLGTLLLTALIETDDPGPDRPKVAATPLLLPGSARATPGFGAALSGQF